MSEKNENRWWENYLVRYLVPSIAGMFILIWLNENSVEGRILEKYFPMLKFTDAKDFNTASLPWGLLLGTLYCYISSYPILVFHAIRVNLFYKISLDKFYKTIFFISIVIYPIIYFVFYYLYNLNINFFNIYSLIFTLEIEFSIFQGYFLYKVSKKGKGYDYMERLAKAKNVEPPNIVETSNIVKKPNTVINAGYIKDITDSYKHLREHGNTALIILFEMLLAFILYFSLRFERENNFMDFSIVSIILIIWIFPAALVYFYGHLLERKFSRFRYEIENKKNKKNK